MPIGRPEISLSDLERMTTHQELIGPDVLEEPYDPLAFEEAR